MLADVDTTDEVDRTGVLDTTGVLEITREPDTTGADCETTLAPLGTEVRVANTDEVNVAVTGELLTVPRLQRPFAHWAITELQNSRPQTNAKNKLDDFIIRQNSSIELGKVDADQAVEPGVPANWILVLKRRDSRSPCAKHAVAFRLGDGRIWVGRVGPALRAVRTPILLAILPNSQLSTAGQSFSLTNQPMPCNDGGKMGNLYIALKADRLSMWRRQVSMS